MVEIEGMSTEKHTNTGFIQSLGLDGTNCMSGVQMACREGSRTCFHVYFALIVGITV